MSSYTGDIVKDGLTLYLDAANYKSFVSGSTTWYDLARPGFTGSLINGPAYTGSNKGAIIFDGSNDYALIPSSSLVSGSQMTFAVWNFGINAQNSCLIWFGNSANVRILSVHIPWGDNTLYFDAGDGSGNNYDRISKVPTASEYQGWNYWTFIKNSTTGTMKIFRNGEEWHANTTFLSRPIGAASGSAFLCFGPAAGVGFDVYHRGRIGMVKLYNRQLSASEIRENYNATKGRYDTTRSSDAIKPRLSTSGLVLHLDAANYRSFVSGSTTWRDLSGNNNNATLNNGPTYNSDNNGSIIFDGSNDYGINASAPNGFNFNVTNAITAEAMIYYSPSSYDFWFTGNNSGIKYRFGTNPSGQFFWDMGQHVDRNYTSYVLPSNVWQHVTFTGGLEGGVIITRIYVNGNLITTQNEGISTLSTTSDFYVGAGETSTSWLFNGRIANLKIYNRALSAAEVVQNFNTNKGRYGYVR